jgi:uncharacterized SAM-binding protein YcdF (DUF218 family)
MAREWSDARSTMRQTDDAAAHEAGLRGLRALGGIAVGLLLLTGLTPLPNVLSYWLAPGRPLEQSGAIVVLGSGGITRKGELTDTSLRRVMDGIDLYREGRAPLLILSGSPFGPGGNEATARAEVARMCGIPAEAILTVSTARTTHDEAVIVWTMLAPRHVRRIILVTDAAGMQRAMAVFARAGFDVIPGYGMPVLDLGGAPRARVSLMHRLLMEQTARLYYRLVGYL